MNKWYKRLESIYTAKKKRRRELAQLPVEKKFEILLQLQKTASSIFKTRNLIKDPWMTIKLSQIWHSDTIEPANTTPIRMENCLNQSISSDIIFCSDDSNSMQSLTTDTIVDSWKWEKMQ